MINPDDVTQYGASRAWKEEFLLFCACVAGKSAFQQAKKVDEFLQELAAAYAWRENDIQPFTPFELIREFDGMDINHYLKCVRMGQYERLTTAFVMLAQLDVDTCTIEDLERIPGIGPKTARFFIVHTRQGVRHAILDTHILAYLRDQGHNAPKSTPSGKKYTELEEKVLALADASGMTPADWDLMVWKSRRKENVA